MDPALFVRRNTAITATPLVPEIRLHLAAEVTPIREVDDRPIGEGTVGPITKRLQARFFDVVRGKDTSHSEWLTKV